MVVATQERDGRRRRLRRRRRNGWCGDIQSRDTESAATASSSSGHGVLSAWTCVPSIDGWMVGGAAVVMWLPLVVRNSRPESHVVVLRIGALVDQWQVMWGSLLVVGEGFSWLILLLLFGICSSREWGSSATLPRHADRDPSGWDERERHTQGRSGEWQRGIYQLLKSSKTQLSCKKRLVVDITRCLSVFF